MQRGGGHFQEAHWLINIFTINYKWKEIIILELLGMKLSRRRSQQGHPTGSGFITGHRSDSVKSLVKAANWEYENDRCLELGSSNSRFPEEQAYLLEAISNVRPSSAITSMNKLGKVDLKSGASNPFHKKLEIKVHNLIEQRKRLVSRLQ